MSVYDVLKKRTLQLLAGAAQGTIADSHNDADVKADEVYAKEHPYLHSIMSAVPSALGHPNYRPAIVDAPGSLIGLAQTAGHYLAPSVVAPVTDGSYAANALDRSNLASDRTHAALGIEQPQDWMDQATEIGGGLIVPGPKVKAIRAVTVPGKIASKVAHIATEAVIPTRNTGLISALKTQVPLGVGVREVIHHLAPQQDAGYTPLIGDKTVPAGISDPLSDDFDPLHAQRQADPLSDDFVPGHQVASNIKDLNADNHDFTTLQKVALGTAGVAAAGLGIHMAHAGLSKILSTGADIADSMSGSKVTATNAGIGERIVGAIMQHDQVARNMSDEFLTPEQAAHYKYNSDRIVPQALGSKIHHAMATGELPGSSVVAKPLAPLLQSIEQELNPIERQMVSNSLLAKTSLEDAANNGGVRASFNDKTDPELQQMVDVVQNDPKLSKYADAVREQHRSLLQYRADPAVGLVSPEQFRDMTTSRPNYVHLSKDEVREGAPGTLFSTEKGSSMLDEAFSRGTEERSGVQFGAARDPIDDLTGRYAATIRLGQINAIKRDFFTDMMNSPAARETVTANDDSTVKLFQEISGKPNSMEGIHTVWDNGQAKYYKVNDGALDRALQFTPRATLDVFGTMRQIAQQATTGIGNPLFGTTVSPVYDTMASLVMRPAGQQLGIVNEVLSKVINAAGINEHPLSSAARTALGYADPTTYLAAPINAIRRAGDELTGAMANSMATRLLKDHDWLVQALGQNKAENFRDFLQGAYKNSLLSQLEGAGVSSHAAYSADSGRSVPVGLQDIAPDYLAGASGRAWQQAVKGNAPAYRKVLETMQAGGRLAMGAPVIRQLSNLYGAVARNMQEGTRYGFAATNLAKVKSVQDWEKLMSQTRRIATDPGQYGNNMYWNKAADATMYANVGVQSLGQIAQRFGQGKWTAIANTLAAVGALTALRYGGIFNDPDTHERTLAKTDVQNAGSISLPGGIEMAIAPEMRLITAPLFATLDHLSGVSDGNFNPSFVQAIGALMDDHSKEDWEGTDKAAGDAFGSALQGVSPISFSSIPAVGAYQASEGLDPGMTRMTGEASPIQQQQVSGLGGDGKTTNSFLSAQTSAVIQSLTGSSVLSAIEAADQWHRAMLSQNANGTKGTSPLGALKVGMSVFTDNQAKVNTPLHGALFSDYKKAQSVANTDYNLFKAKSEGIDKATMIMDKDKKHLWITGDPRYGMLRPRDLVPPNLVGTPIGKIADLTAPLSKQLNKIDRQESGLVKAINDIKNQSTTTIESRNKQINELNKKRQALYSDRLRITHITEDRIGQSIGDDNFTFQNFDPEHYAASPQ